jgi:hypothetical protein
VPLLAMFMSYVGVLFRLFVFAEIMMMGGLVMMVRRCVVMSGSLVMMLTGRMLWGLCHGAIPPNQSKRMRWLRLGVWGDLPLSTRPGIYSEEPRWR